MRKSFVTKTVLQCPEAWQLFCDNFPNAVIMSEDVGNKEVLIVYTDDKKDLCLSTPVIALTVTRQFHQNCLLVEVAGSHCPSTCATRSGRTTGPVRRPARTLAPNISKQPEQP